MFFPKTLCPPTSVIWTVLWVTGRISLFPHCSLTSHFNSCHYFNRVNPKTISYSFHILKCFNLVLTLVNNMTRGLLWKLFFLGCLRALSHSIQNFWEIWFQFNSYFLVDYLLFYLEILRTYLYAYFLVPHVDMPNLNLFIYFVQNLNIFPSVLEN